MHTPLCADATSPTANLNLWMFDEMPDNR